MAWEAPETVVQGQLMDVAFWHSQIRDNSLALRAGGLALPGQIFHDLLIATSATQLGRLLAVAGSVPYYTGGAWTMRNLAGLLYPVGSLFAAVVETNPTDLMGFGTWTLFGSGRVVLAVNPADPTIAAAHLTGGALTHTLTEAEMPAHGHPVIDPGHFHLVGYKLEGSGDEFGTDEIQHYPNDVARTSQTVTTGVTVGNAGSGQAHSNLQPYLVVFCWRRVA